MVGNPAIKINKNSLSQGTLFIEINEALLEGDKTKLKIEMYDGDKLIETISSNFLGPRNF